MAEKFEPGRVCEARLLCSRVRNITIAAEALAGVAFEPGADVTLRFPGADGGAEERQYSVWRSNAQAGTLDVCVVLHELGPGSRWAGRCAAGDSVAILLSRALPIALDTSARAHVILGDETSIASAEAIIRATPADAAVLTCFEVASMESLWPDGALVRPEEVRWVYRSGRPGNALVSWLAHQRLPPAASTAAYVTGEAWLCALVHSHLVRERGFRADAVRAMPYWKQRVR